MYKLVERELFQDEIGSYVTYGVSHEECEINDISMNKSEVQKFISRLNKHEVKPMFLFELVDDFLGEIYGV